MELACTESAGVGGEGQSGHVGHVPPDYGGRSRCHPKIKDEAVEKVLENVINRH